jgi:hypothetical protein
MSPNRIARLREVPAPFRDTDYHNAAKLPQIHVDDDLVMEYGLSAPSCVGDSEPELDEVVHSIRRQVCTAWIFQNGRSVGGAILRRYTMPAFMDNDEFVDLMDMDEGSEHEMSVALTSVFEDLGSDIAAYGDILEINRIWLAPQPELAGRSPSVIKALAAAFCPDFSILVLKAFPLEYESAFGSSRQTLDFDLTLEAALKRRQRAMMRYYRQHFDVEPLPSSFGADGWMYRLRADIREMIEQ